MANRQSDHRVTVWRPEYDAELLADWHNGVSLSEFARRFGYAGKRGASMVRKHAIRLGLLELDERGLTVVRSRAA